MTAPLARVNSTYRVAVATHRPPDNPLITKTRIASHVTFARNPRQTDKEPTPAQLGMARAVWSIMWDYVSQKRTTDIPEIVRKSSNQGNYWLAWVGCETIATRLGVQVHSVKKAFVTLRLLGRLVTIERPGTRDKTKKAWVGRTSDKWLITTAEERTASERKTERVKTKKAKGADDLRLVCSLADEYEEWQKQLPSDHPEKELRHPPAVVIETKEKVKQEWCDESKYHLYLSSDQVAALPDQVDGLTRKLEAEGCTEKQVVSCLKAWRNHKPKEPFNKYQETVGAGDFTGVRSKPAVLLSRMTTTPTKPTHPRPTRSNF